MFQILQIICVLQHLSVHELPANHREPKGTPKGPKGSPRAPKGSQGHAKGSLMAHQRQSYMVPSIKRWSRNSKYTALFRNKKLRFLKCGMSTKSRIVLFPTQKRLRQYPQRVKCSNIQYLRLPTYPISSYRACFRTF